MRFWAILADMLDWREVWILPHSSPKILLFAFFFLLGSSFTFFQGWRHRWQAEGLETADRDHVLASCIRGTRVSVQAHATGSMFLYPVHPGLSVDLCPNCYSKVRLLSLQSPWPACLELYKVFLWLCHTILEITRVPRWSPVVMDLEHGIKHCLPWVMYQQHVRGYNTCQDNFRGLHKDWKKTQCLSLSSVLPAGEPQLPQQPQGNQIADSRK